MVRISLLTILATMALWPSPSEALDLQIGGVLGAHEPLDQEDATDDLLFGVRGRLPAWRGIYLEPSITYIDMDREPYRVRNVPQEVQEWNMVALALNGSWGPGLGQPGVQPYLTAGVGYYLQRKLETPDTERLGFDVGLGLVVPMKPNIDLDFRGALTSVSLEQSGSRGLASLSVGILYHVER